MLQPQQTHRAEFVVAGVDVVAGDSSCFKLANEFDIERGFAIAFLAQKSTPYRDFIGEAGSLVLERERDVFYFAGDAVCARRRKSFCTSRYSDSDGTGGPAIDEDGKGVVIRVERWDFDIGLGQANESRREANEPDWGIGPADLRGPGTWRNGEGRTARWNAIGDGGRSGPDAREVDHNYRSDRSWRIRAVDTAIGVDNDSAIRSVLQDPRGGGDDGDTGGRTGLPAKGHADRGRSRGRCQGDLEVDLSRADIG